MDPARKYSTAASRMDDSPAQEFMDALAAFRREQEAERKTTALVWQRIEGKVDGLIKTVGREDEDEYGRPVGVGIIGRLMRLEKRVDRRFSLYDGWKKYAAGIAAGAGVLFLVIWWLVGDRLGAILKS